MLTVKQLSDMAGVTRRTLRYYDQIGLLKPTCMGDNGYRYDEQAVLRMQQILLYRKSGLSLETIRNIMQTPWFNVIEALQQHKLELRKQISQLKRLVSTVEDTIDYLKGRKGMSQKQHFEALSDEQQAEYEKEAMQMYDPEIVKKSNARYRKLTEEEKQRIGKEGNAIYADLVEAMPQGPASAEVQDCIKRWHEHMLNFWSPNDEQLLGLADLYSDDPRFKANFDKIHPQLGAFMREAVKIYVAGHKK